MKYLTIFNAISRSMYILLIFTTVQKAEHLIYIPLINSLCYISVGLAAVFLVLFKFNIEFKIPSIKELIFFFNDSWHIFLSNLAISLYTISNTFILGLFTNTTIVGYYSAGERIVKFFIFLLTPVSQTIYPFISKLMNESKERGLFLIHKLIRYMLFVTFTISLLLFILSPYIVQVLLGKEFYESIKVIKLLSFLPLIIGLSNIFGIQTMLPLNYKKEFSRIIISVGLFNVILLLLLCPIFKHIGAALSFLISESLVTSSMFLFLYQKKILIPRLSNV